MQTDTLIVGQGLCGTWLSYWLQQAGADFIVLDQPAGNSASKVASGIINPVTGRRMAKTWLADELLPFAEASYAAFEKILSVPLINTTAILDFFAAPDRRLSFEKRAQQFEDYLEWPEDNNAWATYFNYPFGYGIVAPVYRVNLHILLAGWRAMLSQQNQLSEEFYDAKLLELVRDGVQYKNISAKRIVFCDGVHLMQQPFFNLLPFAINKGEALIVSIPGLPTEYLYKKTNLVTPWTEGLFWVGSSYDRDFKDDQPSAIFYGDTKAWLQQFLKIPFNIEAHVAALRPTTVERRPFAGFHPAHPQIGIFNGMGTKGVSLAPYFGKQFADHITDQKPLSKEVDVKMYARILQRA